MNLTKYVPNGVTRTAARQALKLQKNSPTLMFGAGVVGVVATVVLASRATLKLEGVLESTKGHLDDIDTVQHDAYSDTDRTTDKAVVYTRAVFGVIKLYAPAAAVGVVSIGCLTGAHVTLTRRNTAVVAAYAALEKGFKEYRQRVLEDVGEDKEREYRYGSVTVTEKVVDDAGKTKTLSRTQVPNGMPSIYAKFFDETSTEWKRNPEINKIFLRAQQEYANQILQVRGHLFLNEVYDALGLTRTKAGAVVGWVIEKDGDNFVDFGIFDGDHERIRDFVNGHEGSILLDFNVNGVIYDKI